MKPVDFDYSFPSSLIATEPPEVRSQARLLVYDRARDDCSHLHFSDLPTLLRSSDLLVVNESKVLPARFFGRRLSGAALEGLYLGADGEQTLCWLKGRVKEGEVISIDGWKGARVIRRDQKRCWLDIAPSLFESFLWKSGTVPLPPYIEAARAELGVARENVNDRQQYQTVFSSLNISPKEFSVAAPTASLHFDIELLSQLENVGVEVVRIQLHVGEGTFEPLEPDLELSKQRLHSEKVEISEAVRNRLLQARQEGRRIIAVGTTALRAIESMPHFSQQNQFNTDLFIRPPYRFRMADALITNFHWPQSSLLILVATFLEAQIEESGVRSCPEALRGLWKRVYSEAVKNGYRLFSYGDGMLII